MSDSNYGRNNSICSEISVTYLHATALNYSTEYSVTYVNKPYVLFGHDGVQYHQTSCFLRDTFVSYISYRIPTITSSSLQEE